MATPYIGEYAKVARLKQRENGGEECTGRCALSNVRHALLCPPCERAADRRNARD